MRLGSGFIGTDSIKVSTTHQQIIPPAPSHWTMGYSLYKLTFMNYQDCRIKINNGNPIFLQANQGFKTSEVDAVIDSFIIVESGIEYQFIAGY